MANNDPLSVEQINSTNRVKDKQDNTGTQPADNLSALGHVPDTCPAPVSDIVANTDTSVNLANTMPTENTTLRQNIVEENAKGNASTNAWKTVKRKSKGKLKHERNLASVSQAISVTMEATRNGKTNEEIKQIGMDAANAICKSYANILSKKHNGNLAKSISKGHTISQNKENIVKISHIGQYKKNSPKRFCKKFFLPSPTFAC